jgi:hypothetical protein
VTVGLKASQTCRGATKKRVADDDEAEKLAACVACRAPASCHGHGFCIRAKHGLRVDVPPKPDAIWVTAYVPSARGVSSSLLPENHDDTPRRGRPPKLTADQRAERAREKDRRRYAKLRDQAAAAGLSMKDYKRRRAAHPSQGVKPL